MNCPKCNQAIWIVIVRETVRFTGVLRTDTNIIDRRIDREVMPEAIICPACFEDITGNVREG